MLIPLPQTKPQAGSIEDTLVLNQQASDSEAREYDPLDNPYDPKEDRFKYESSERCESEEEQNPSVARAGEYVYDYEFIFP